MKKLLSLVLSAALALCLSTCAFGQLRSPLPEQLQKLAEAAEAGDVAAGKAAEAEYAAQLAREGSSSPEISFDELCLLAKYIEAKAGSPRYSDELRLCAGELALNRVASPEYPNTLAEVAAADGLPYTAALAAPTERGLPRRCVEAALRLLLGERLMEPDVVIQTSRREGDVYATFGDQLLGFTYFCRSEHPELYETGD